MPDNRTVARMAADTLLGAMSSVFFDIPDNCQDLSDTAFTDGKLTEEHPTLMEFLKDTTLNNLDWKTEGVPPAEGNKARFKLINKAAEDNEKNIEGKGFVLISDRDNKNGELRGPRLRQLIEEAQTNGQGEISLYNLIQNAIRDPNLSSSFIYAITPIQMYMMEPGNGNLEENEAKQKANYFAYTLLHIVQDKVKKDDRTEQPFSERLKSSSGIINQSASLIPEVNVDVLWNLVIALPKNDTQATPARLAELLPIIQKIVEIQPDINLTLLWNNIKNKKVDDLNTTIDTRLSTLSPLLQDMEQEIQVLQQRGHTHSLSAAKEFKTDILLATIEKDDAVFTAKCGQAVTNAEGTLKEYEGWRGIFQKIANILAKTFTLGKVQQAMTAPPAKILNSFQTKIQQANSDPNADPRGNNPMDDSDTAPLLDNSTTSTKSTKSTKPPK
jgi:hypothetical protein